MRRAGRVGISLVERKLRVRFVVQNPKVPRGQESARIQKLAAEVELPLRDINLPGALRQQDQPRRAANAPKAEDHLPGPPRPRRRQVMAQQDGDAKTTRHQNKTARIHIPPARRLPFRAPGIRRGQALQHRPKPERQGHFLRRVPRPPRPQVKPAKRHERQQVQHGKGRNHYPRPRQVGAERSHEVAEGMGLQRLVMPHVRLQRQPGQRHARAKQQGHRLPLPALPLPPEAQQHQREHRRRRQKPRGDREQGHQGRSRAAPPGRRAGRMQPQQPQREQREQHQKVELRLKPGQRVLPPKRQRQHQRQRQPHPHPVFPLQPAEHQPPQPGQRGAVDQGVADHLQPPVPLPVQQQQRQPIKPGEQYPVLVMRGKQVRQGQFPGQERHIHHARLLPLIPKRQRRPKPVNEPQPRSQASQEEAGRPKPPAPKDSPPGPGCLRLVHRGGFLFSFTRK